ncbi:MAG: hypothetical protein ACI8Z1_001600 [Candidatus Azotimanducaceae bacterium]|jgi:hypothetical protein
MRQLSKNEEQTVNGGNPRAAALLSLGSSYSAGEWAGIKLTSFVNRTFSMSTGRAAYYTFNNK